MIVNAGSLIALQQSFNALFQSSLMAATPVWSKVAMEIQSTHKAEIHQWLGRVPQMREWIDEKSVDGLRGFQYTITNKDYEMTIGVDRNDIEDDMLGMYQPRIREMGVRASYHPDKLLSAARAAGHTTACYDGQYFYDTDHVEGDSGSQSNYLTGTGTTLSTLGADFFTAQAAMMALLDDKGEPFIEPAMVVAGYMDMPSQWLVTCPPALYSLFYQLFNAQVISQTSNTLFRAAQLVPDSRLTDTNDWYLDFVGGIVRPYIKQTRKPPVMVSLVDPNMTESVFMTREFKFGVESRGAISYGLWQYSSQTHN